jgi:SAM-dependent methyltransferase
MEREKFYTSWVSVFFNPNFFIRRGLFKYVKAYASNLDGVILDFGCGQKPYESLFKGSSYIGLDIESSGHPHSNSKVDVFYDGKKIPFEDEHFDSVFSSETLTHVFNQNEIMLELNRILKPGGMILITVPFSWFENEIPYDNNRFTFYGIKYLLESTGFEIIKSDKTTNFVQTVFQLSNAYVFNFVGRNTISRLLLMPFVIFPQNLIGSILSFILPENKSLFCNNIILAKKTNNSLK